MSEVEVTLPNDWRPWQAEQWQALKRFNVLVVHRRAGKTVLCCLWLVARLLERPNAVGAYVGPQKDQLRRNIWPLWKRLAGQVPGANFNETLLRTEFPNGSVCYVVGTENAASIRGIGLDAAVLDEVAQIGPAAWNEVIRPALADRQGAAVFIGTPLGTANLFHELYEYAGGDPTWHRALLTWQDTGAIPPAEIEALQREMGPEAFAQEFECSFTAAVRGAYYARQMAQADLEGRIGNVPVDPLLPVHTSWDLGINDSTVVICWQVAGAEVRVVDCLAFQNTGLPDIAAVLRQKPFAWGTHYAPHDAKVRELGSGKSRQEIALGLGLAWQIVPEVGLMGGIESARALIPRCWFDRTRCKDLIEALRVYRTEYDDVRNVYSLKPLHDWSSHYADAFRYFAVGSQGKSPDWGPIDYSTYDRAVI